MTNKKVYSLINQVERLKRGKATRFLDLGEVRKLELMLKKDEYKVYYPYPDCEKIIVYSREIPEVSIIKINCNEELEHREIMGSLYGLNVNSEYWGDIIKYDSNYYVVVLKELEEFIINNLFMIGNKYVELERLNIQDINYVREYVKENIIVSSLRIDNVIAKITNSSRKMVKEKIQNKEVILNFEMLKNSNYYLNDGDVFSIRRYGKYKFKGIVKMTKKQNYVIEYWKYI